MVFRHRELLGPKKFMSQSPLDNDEQREELDKAIVYARFMKINLLNNIALFNGAVIVFFVSAAGYNLFHEYVEAAIALFYYNDSMEASALATTMALIFKFPMDSISNYASLVATNPIFYKACTSGVAYTLGDFVSQVYQGRTLDTIDLARSARSGTAGFIGHGPLCHYWMTFMENYLDFGGAWWATGIKVIADQTVWSIWLNACYSFIIGILAFRDPKVVWEDVKKTSWPALRTSWRFWPFVHVISFSHIVNLDLKLLWVDAMEIVWVTLLSKVANDDKAKVVVEECVDEVCMIDGGVAEPATEVAMTVMMEKKLAQQRMDTSDEIEATDNTALDLVKQGWDAAWPFAAMWPLLYAAHLFELNMASGMA
eukprot:CAMPEP_0185750318 /NCGR_PEP_ID=MMETSP1174-20130828/9087_1 /TAXON_ID=35687 /ORGANISM="Dictyocha speculum, Strain CCMP1381" /LENGTH=368 /DNA_ID=CAMNT_0028426831 /DNA_START=165 /DNA_END=1271 /DNA_ORIENTATION=-